MNAFNTRQRIGKSIEAVPATAELLRQFYGKPLDITVRAIVFIKDGELVGVAGLKTEQGQQVLFSDTKADANVSKMEKWRCYQMVVDAIKSSGRMTFAIVERGDFASQRSILMSGFRLVDTNNNGEVYLWHKQQHY